MLATIGDLAARFGRDLDDMERTSGTAALRSLSVKANHLAGADYDGVNVPAMVRETVLDAAERYLRNPDGLAYSRSDGEGVGWGGSQGPQPADFTDKETEYLSSLKAGRSGFGVVPCHGYVRGSSSGVLRRDDWPHSEFPDTHGTWWDVSPWTSP